MLVGTALLVVATTGGSFLLGEIYHINPGWLFFAWNSILTVPLFIKQFRRHISRLPFALFLIAWAIAHGIIVICLMRWIPLPYWIPVLGAELLLGYLIAYWGFGIEASRLR
jgi:hypothetical protein